MSMTGDSPYPYQPGSLIPAPRPAPSRVGTLIASVAALAGCAAVGLLGGLAWSAAAPNPVYVVISRGSADVVNAETTAFIVADAWFCLIAVIGGLIIGILSYRLAIRKYGPGPMAAVLAGSVGAGVLARWVGQNLGLAHFNSLLLTAKVGTLLHAPPVLGGDTTSILWPAIAFWPLGACVIPGGLLIVAALRDRQPAGRGRFR